ncbi:MAG: AAA family ATPase [Opitutae bacterium]|nr:AAA family ATPase [Opitutae bacterium]
MDPNEINELQRNVREASAFASRLRTEIGRVVAGQENLITRMIMALLTDGHLLVEGLPGLAKTLAIKTLSQAIGGTFSRVQFTPDLLPADVTGTTIYNAAKGEFSVKEGPVFANILLADEINRAPAKVQAALLEAMQERQTTIGGETRKLPTPFFVMATQNPIEQEGTYPLPEAQIDRFLFKVCVDYPSRNEELQVVERMARMAEKPVAMQVCTLDDVIKAREVMDKIYIDGKILEYVLDLVIATRPSRRDSLSSRQSEVDLSKIKDWVSVGASPRAPIALTLAAKANAFLDGRAYVVPQDVKSVAVDILAHRISPSYEAEAEGVSTLDILNFILENLKTP